MFYIILIACVCFALFLIFRDDHDRSYNRNETPKPSVSKPVQSITPVNKEYAEDRSQNDMAREGSFDVKKTVDKDTPNLSFLENLEYYEDLGENSETFDVTGLRYYCMPNDRGRIVGVVRPDPSNIHDPRAQAVIRSDGKLLGYIPRTQLDWWEEFNGQNIVCPFVGEIQIDGHGWLIAEIKAIIPVSREFVEDEIESGLGD